LLENAGKRPFPRPAGNHFRWRAWLDLNLGPHPET
jgi:hypothetical protein